MCGRFQLDPDPEITEIVRRLTERSERAAVRYGEIRPTDPAPVLTGAAGSVAPRVCRWGFAHPSGKGILINARAETAPSGPFYGADFAERRCAVPASGFYEWSADKRKFLFRGQNGRALWLGGIWREENGAHRFCILTRAASATAARIHGRMPVLIEKDALPDWLSDANNAFEMTRRFPLIELCAAAARPCAQIGFFDPDNSL